MNIKKATSIILWGITGIIAFFTVSLKYAEMLIENPAGPPPWMDILVILLMPISVISFALIIFGIMTCDKYCDKYTEDNKGEESKNVI